MITENLSTLKINKLSQAQYERELAAGNIDPNALYLTPDEEVDSSDFATKEDLETKAEAKLKEANSYTEEYVATQLATKQPVGDYALKSEIPTDEHINSLITAATELPTVTSSDSGKFLRVSADGIWVAETIPHIEEVAF